MSSRLGRDLLETLTAMLNPLPAIALRNNRLALLSSLHGMMNRVADISKLAA